MDSHHIYIFLPRNNKIEFALRVVISHNPTAMAQQTKVFETRFNEYLTKLIYAVYDDIENDWEGEKMYSPLMYMNYGALLMEKKSRPDGLKHRFKLSSEVQQYVTSIFHKMITEFKNIVMDDKDNVVSLTEKLKDGNADCFTAHMFKIGTMYKEDYGATLRGAGDTSLWFHNQIVGLLPQYATKPMLIAIISSEFDNFLKSLSWLIGKFVWHLDNPVTVTSGMFLGMLAQQRIPQILLDELVNGLRAKAPSKPKKRSAAKTAVKDEEAATSAVEVAVEDTSAPVTAKPVDESELDQLLAEV